MNKEEIKIEENTTVVEEKEEKEKDYILEVKNLKTYFPIKKNIWGKPTVYLKAVDDVSFSLERNTTIGVGLRKNHFGQNGFEIVRSQRRKNLFQRRRYHQPQQKANA